MWLVNGAGNKRPEEITDNFTNKRLYVAPDNDLVES